MSASTVEAWLTLTLSCYDKSPFELKIDGKNYYTGNSSGKQKLKLKTGKHTLVIRRRHKLEKTGSFTVPVIFLPLVMVEPTCDEMFPFGATATITINILADSSMVVALTTLKQLKGKQYKRYKVTMKTDSHCEVKEAVAGWSLVEGIKGKWLWLNVLPGALVATVAALITTLGIKLIIRQDGSFLGGLLLVVLGIIGLLAIYKKFRSVLNLLHGDDLPEINVKL